MTSAGGVHDRRKKWAIRFLLRWRSQQAGDLRLRAAVNLPAALNRMLPVRGGVTYRRWKRQPAAALGATRSGVARPAQKAHRAVPKTRRKRL